MIKLERLERAILIFLISAFVLGIIVSVLQKMRPPAKITIEKFDPENYKDTGSDPLAFSEKIDINTACAEDLMKINGVGGIIAGRIIEYRCRDGSFSSIDDLKNVKGVGTALFEKIKSRLKAE
jgi:competence ComEA-like helix-hairpin-helix protein